MANRIQQHGFTLLEIVIVVAIIALLTAMAYPSYQNHIRKTKRVDMMTEMQNIASSIEGAKLAKGKYSEVKVSLYEGTFPRSGSALYDVSISPKDGNMLESGQWTVTANPIVGGMMKTDGVLTLTNDGVKCRNHSGNEQCGKGNQWND